MDFIRDFESSPSLDKFNSLTKQELIHLADHLEIVTTKIGKKKLIQSEVLKALNEKGIFPTDTDSVVEQCSDNQLRLKELEVEMRQLELRERELIHEKEIKEKQLDLEFRKMAHEKELQLKELESRRTSAARDQSFEETGFDLNKWILLVPPFKKKM